MKPWWAGWVVLAVLAGSCERKGEPRPAPNSGSADSEQVSQCVAALQTASTSKGDKLAILATQCASACPGLADYAAGRAASKLDEQKLWQALSRCQAACPAAGEPSSALPEVFQALARACPPEHFGLPKGYRDYVSGDSLAAARIGAWLQEARDHMSAALLGQLDRHTRHLHLPLPPPVSISGHYQLPNSELAQLFSSRFYVVVSPGQASAAAVPVARMRGPVLELRPVPGGRPPGTLLRVGSELATLQGLVELWSEHHSATAPPTFTYLVDQAVPVSRLLEVARSLGHDSFRLGVSGLSAREHPVEVIIRAATAAPVVTLRDGELSMDGAADVVTELRSALVQMAPGNLVELRCAGDPSVAEVVRALDRLADARARRAALVSVSP